MRERYIITGAIIVIALASGIIFYNKTHAVDRSPLQQNTGTKVKGPVTASVTIEEFSDFQCPACSMGQAALNKIFQDYAGEIRIIFYHFPLQNHAWSPLAHQAAECAHAGGKFWEYQDRLFREQANWSKQVNPAESFLTYAKDLGLDIEPFVGCLSNPKIKGIILDDRAKGEKMKITSTPTFFINGQRIVGPFELQLKGVQTIRQILGLPPLVPASKPAVPQTPHTHEAH